MIRSIDAYKLSLIIEGIKSGKLNGKVVISINPSNKADSINKKGNHMKFDATSREYYLEMKEGIKKSFDSNVVSIRHIGRKPEKKGDNTFLDDVFEVLLSDALSYVGSNQQVSLEEKLREEFGKEKQRLV